jgi:hypothetical protein
MSVTTILLAICGILTAGQGPTGQTSNVLQGDYVEARTCSVFAGACHYNGELMVAGREAIQAWDFTQGQYQNIDLAGVKAVAVVACDANLSEESAARQSEIYIDASATPSQAKAVEALLRNRCGDELGNVIDIRTGSILFVHENGTYQVQAPGFAALSVKGMPNDECCKQPNLVWYTPLMHLNHRKVGYTQNAAYLGSTVGDSWQRCGENSAFYGSFTIKP